MDILNEPKKRKSNNVIWIIVVVVIIIFLLFQFVNFAPQSSKKETNTTLIDSLK
jgi:flagellar basal body-associated protein FliL